MTSLEIVAVIFLAGLAGGIVHGFTRPRDYFLSMPLTKQNVRLGFLGDGLVGGTTAIALFFIAPPLLNMNLTDWTEPAEYLKLVSVAVIAGFTGRPLLSSISTRLLNQVSRVEQKVDRLELQEEAEGLLRSGDIHFLRENFQQAIEYYNRVLSRDRANEDARLNRARAMKRLGRVSEAIAECTYVLEHNPDNARALYNRACYRVLEGEPLGQAMADLKSAVMHQSAYRDYAATDPDFGKVRNRQKFNAVIAPPPPEAK